MEIQITLLMFKRDKMTGFTALHSGKFGKVQEIKDVSGTRSWMKSASFYRVKCPLPESQHWALLQREFKSNVSVEYLILIGWKSSCVRFFHLQLIITFFWYEKKTGIGFSFLLSSIEWNIWLTQNITTAVCDAKYYQ